MSRHGRALQKICQDLLRVNFSGTSRKLTTSHLRGAQLKNSSVQHDASRNIMPPLSTASLKFNDLRNETSLETVDKSKEKKDTFIGMSTGLPSVGAKPKEASIVNGTHSPVQKMNLATWPNAGHTEYICPSEKLSTLPDLAILDTTPNSVSYELPKTSSLIPLIIDTPDRPSQSEISEPVNSQQQNVPKEASRIMKIRRRKMNRHQLKKLRKRMLFTYRKIRRDRAKKKEAFFQGRLRGIKYWGDNFDARKWAEDHLNRARKGGFYINVLSKRE